MAAHEDPKPLLKRLIKVAQRTVGHPRRSENHYFRLLLRTMTLSPWANCQDEHLRSVPNQNLATASEFAKRLTQAKNFQEFAQIETAFIQTLMDCKSPEQEAAEARADSLAAAFVEDAAHAPLLPTRSWL
jgi:hypothetical protein